MQGQATDWETWLQAAADFKFELVDAIRSPGTTLDDVRIPVLHKSKPEHGSLFSRWRTWLTHQTYIHRESSYAAPDFRNQDKLGEISYEKLGRSQHTYQGAALMLKRCDDFGAMLMLRRAMTHPLLADGSRINIMRGKVTDPEETRESRFNMKAKTCDGWCLTVGYSRHKDGGYASGKTHAWVMFGKNCNSKHD